jgi:hypothetical protein
MASETSDIRTTPEPLGTDAITRSQSVLSEAERMLQDAVAALESAPIAMQDVGLHPMPLQDWSSICPDLRDPLRTGSFSRETLGGIVDGVTRTANASDERELRIEFARLSLDGERLLQLGSGDVLATEISSQSPVDIWVGDRRIGRGEVLVLDGKLCIQVTELQTTSDSS